MLYAYLIVSGLFLIIAFIVNKNNAKYLLSGYNSMSIERQKNIDFQKIARRFRKLNLFLSFTLLFFGGIIYYFAGLNVAGIFLVLYPVLVYSFESIMSSLKNKTLWKTVILLPIIAILSYFLFSLFRINDMLISEKEIKITGYYGEEIPMEQIRKVEVVSQLPKISLRVNGASLGTARKGYFRIKKGEVVKVFTNKKEGPYLLIAKSNGEKIYYAYDEKSTEKLYEDIKKAQANKEKNE